jgi:hypothetical protein
VAPPKRKTTGGRVTPKGTQPGQFTTAHRESSLASRPTTGRSEHDAAHSASGIAASTRYTPPTPKDVYESPTWVPILMGVLLGLGVLVILLRYIVWPDSNWPVLIGLGCMLGGLFTATKWH